MIPVKAINHLGIAVRSIDAQRAFYDGTLGAVFEGVEVVADQKVRVGFFRIGDVRLEPACRSCGSVLVVAAERGKPVP